MQSLLPKVSYIIALDYTFCTEQLSLTQQHHTQFHLLISGGTMAGPLWQYGNIAHCLHLKLMRQYCVLTLWLWGGGTLSYLLYSFYGLQQGLQVGSHEHQLQWDLQ